MRNQDSTVHRFVVTPSCVPGGLWIQLCCGSCCCWWDLVGRPVVSIADGLDIAEVKDVVFEPDRHALMGFTLNKRGFWRGSLRELLPTANISAIGPDAVMVDSADALAPPDQAPVELQPGSKRHGVLGARVMTSGGRSLGVITGVIVSLGSRFEVVGYEIDGPEQTKSSQWSCGQGPPLPLFPTRPKRGDGSPPHHPLDAKVLGTDGFERGKVADIAFDPASGALRSLAVNGVNVPASCIRSLGPYCWVVDASVPFS